MQIRTDAVGGHALDRGLGRAYAHTHTHKYGVPLGIEDRKRRTSNSQIEGGRVSIHLLVSFNLSEKKTHRHTHTHTYTIAVLVSCSCTILLSIYVCARVCMCVCASYIHSFMSCGPQIRKQNVHPNIGQNEIDKMNICVNKYVNNSDEQSAKPRPNCRQPDDGSSSKAQIVQSRLFIKIFFIYAGLCLNSKCFGTIRAGAASPFA